jgi:acyl carrier protein
LTRVEEDALIEKMIAAFIAAELIGDPGVDVDVEQNLISDGSLDSVGVMRLVAHLETTFGMRIPPTDLVPEHFRTIRLMADYLARKGVSAPVPPGP